MPLYVVICLPEHADHQLLLQCIFKLVINFNTEISSESLREERVQLCSLSHLFVLLIIPRFLPACLVGVKHFVHLFNLFLKLGTLLLNSLCFISDLVVPGS